ncbi:unnamed protein product [Leptosia nina]|uniref:Uncharacterized protein n=1 Tax=Leptosia nina TaxID=320188 RepID=A0AAV1JBZ3_9NEOP
MQLADLFCYATLLITLTPALVHSENENNELLDSTKHSLKKRETIVLYDNFPSEPIYKTKPRVTYRRISYHRPSPKPKYGPPRTKYRSAKPPRRPIKKYKKTVPKYGPPSRKKRPVKPRYGPPKNSNPVYSPPKKPYPDTHTYILSEPAGFGEPPQDYYSDYSSPKQSFAEPPLDFHTPSRPFDFYQLSQDSNPTSFDSEPSFHHEFKNWNPHQSGFNFDTTYEFTNPEPSFKERDFEPSSPDDEINTYLEQYKYRELPTDEEPNLYERKRRPYYIDNIIITKPQKTHKKTDSDTEVVVGGKYAEPPARVVHKSYSNDYSEDDEIPSASYVDPEVAVSATISPYVNYKNSNLAFSPQNLNDAFSIVDKK